MEGANKEDIVVTVSKYDDYILLKQFREYGNVPDDELIFIWESIQAADYEWGPQPESVPISTKIVAELAIRGYVLDHSEGFIKQKEE